MPAPSKDPPKKSKDLAERELEAFPIDSRRERTLGQLRERLQDLDDLELAALQDTTDQPGLAPNGPGSYEGRKEALIKQIELLHNRLDEIDAEETVSVLNKQPDE